MQFRRGSTSQNNTFTGAVGEISINTTLSTIRVHDGTTAGGWETVGTTQTQTLSNKTEANVTLSGTVTANGTVGTAGQFLSSNGSGANVAWVTLSTTSITNGTSTVTLPTSGGNILANVGGATIATVSSGGINLTGNLTATSGTITRAGNVTAPAWTVAGAGVTSSSAYYTDSTSFGTVSNHVAINALGTPTLAAQSATTWAGGASTLYIANAVVSGSNSTLSSANTYALYIANGNVYFGGTSTVTSQLNVANSISSTTTISATGNITGGNINTGGVVATNNIINNGSNGTGNIGSSSTYYNTAFIKATSAQYADLAEKYQGDDAYAPGTVVIFGGSDEVTQSTTSHDPSVAGVVSTNPSYIMNSGLETENSITVALTGRVPTQVIGPIAKGDRVVSSNQPGVACRLDMANYQPGCIIGKALESYNGPGVGIIEIVVGRV